MGKGLWIALGGLVTVAGVSVFGLYRLATRYYDFGGASSELPAALAAYRRDGLPFVASDLFPPHPRSEENAAPAIRAAIGSLPPKAAGTRLTQQFKKTDADADLLLNGPYRKALDTVGRAVDRPRVDFGRDWDLGPFVLFPEYAGMKTLAKAATLRAVRDAARGDDAAALKDLTLARQLGLWAGEEPTLIGMLVRIAIESIALDGAERCLVSAAARPERIVRYGAWLKGSPPLPSFGEALRGEMFLGVTTVRNLDLFGGFDAFGKMATNDEGPPKFVDPARLRRSGLPEDAKLRGFLARHLQTWDEAYRVTDRFAQPPEAIGRHLDAVEARIEREKGFSYVLLRVLFPVFSQAGAAVVNLEARRTVEVGFAEALAVHARTGRWPTRVAGTDPFTGKPLRVRSGKDFRVWSVGRDRKDDGGLLRREAPKRPDATADEVAVYPPVPR